MKFRETTIRVLVRKNYGECFDFYTQKLGLHVVWGDRNGPYTSFAAESQEEPCFAIFLGDAMTMFQGYVQPDTEKQPYLRMIWIRITVVYRKLVWNFLESRNI